MRFSHICRLVPQVILIPVDLNNLPDDQLSTFYRILLRSFYEQQERFKPSLQQTIYELYRKVEATQDPFLSQSALRELLTLFREQEMRIVFGDESVRYPVKRLHPK